MSEFAIVKKILPGKTVVFRTPIEGEDVLVRTGCTSESSSFLHCVLHSYMKDYPSMDIKEQIKCVNRIRSSLSSKIDSKSWEKMDNDRSEFKENICDITLNCCLFFKNDPRARGSATHRVIKNLIGDDEKLLEVYKLITELIPQKEEFEKTIITSTFENSEDQKIYTLRTSIIKNTISYVKKKKEVKSVSQEKVKNICDLVNKFLSAVLKEAEEEAYKSFVSNSEKILDDVNSHTISLVSKKIKRDIYLIDSKNRMPYLNPQTVENLKRRKSIIILCISKGIYEVVGKLLPGNAIQREFDHSEQLIKKIYTFLVNPEKISDEFKDLIKYLPNEFQNSESSNSSSSSSNSEDSSNEDDSD
jgi:hypothetical protein